MANAEEYNKKVMSISKTPKGIELIKKAAVGLADIRSNIAAKQSEIDINRRKSFGLPETATPNLTTSTIENKPIIETPTKVTGLSETTPFSEAKRIYNETWHGAGRAVEPKPEEYIPAAGGTSKPYGYPEEGKVYTNEDLNQPMTGGGFGYVSKGLPEAKVNIEDYYRETITKMQDRADKLALQIESGFAKGKRLTAAAEELRGIQSTIPLMMAGLTESITGVKGKEAEIGKTEAEKAKLERETAGLPRTPEEAKSFLEAKTTGDITAKMGLVKQYQAAYTKIEQDVFLTDPVEKAAQLAALNDQYRGTIPEYLVGEGAFGSTGLPGGSIPKEGEEKTLPDGSRWRRTATGWQRWSK